MGSAAIVLLLLAACQEQELPVTVVTDRFDVALDFEGPLCGGNIPYMEARLAWLEQALEMRGPERIRFNWLTREHEFCESGPYCARGASIYSDWRSFDHELVHATLDGLGRAHPFLEEGMAEAFSQRYGVDGLVPSRWLDGPYPGELSDLESMEYYTSAGHFTRYLHDSYGVAKLKDLYTRSDYDEGSGKFRANFMEVYGVSFDEVEVDYMEFAWQHYPPLAGCPEPNLAWDGEAFSADLTLDCEDPAVLRIDETTMMRTATVELPEPTHGMFTADAEFGLIDHCRPGPGDIEPGPILGAGRHTLKFQADIEAPRSIHVEFVPRP